MKLNEQIHQSCNGKRNSERNISFSSSPIQQPKNYDKCNKRLPPKFGKGFDNFTSQAHNTPSNNILFCNNYKIPKIDLKMFLKLQGWKPKYQNKVTAVLPHSTIHENLMEELGIDMVKI